MEKWTLFKGQILYGFKKADGIADITWLKSELRVTLSYFWKKMLMMSIHLTLEYFQNKALRLNLEKKVMP